MTNPTGKTLIDIPDATRLLLGPGADPRRGYDLAKQGRMPGLVRIGRRLRVDQTKLVAFIDAGGEALPGGWRRRPAARPVGLER